MVIKMRMYRLNIMLIVFIQLLVLVISQQQLDFTPTVLLQEDDKYIDIKYKSVSQNIQHLSYQSQPLFHNTFINKSFSINTNQHFTYQSTVPSPIFIVDKQNCHSHQGTIQMHQIQHLSSHHTSKKINQNNQQKIKDTQQKIQEEQSQSSSSFISSDSYVYNKKYGILYRVSGSDLKVSAYRVNKDNMNKKYNQVYESQFNSNINSYDQSHLQNNNEKIGINNKFNKSITLLGSLSLLQINSQGNNQQDYIDKYQQCLGESNILLVLSKSMQSVYILTCGGIYMIKCQSILSRVQLLMHFNNQAGNKQNQSQSIHQQDKSIIQQQRIFNGIQIISHNGYLFWLSSYQGIRIYAINQQQKLQYINTIITPTQQQIKSLKKNNQNQQKNNQNQQKNNQTEILNTQTLNKTKTTLNKQVSSSIKVTSLQYQNGLLYILSEKNGVLVYERKLGFMFQLKQYIQYLPQYKNKINYQIIIRNNLILIWTRVKKWQFITQIKIIQNIKKIQNNDNINDNVNNDNTNAYNEYNRQENIGYVLNRYYKGYRSIHQIQHLTHYYTTKQNNNQQNHTNKDKNTNTNKDNTNRDIRNDNKVNRQVLMISSQKGIQLFAIGQDVREIPVMMNGLVNNHIGDDYTQIVHINQNIWLIQKTNQDIQNDQKEQQDNKEQDNKEQQQVQIKSDKSIEDDNNISDDNNKQDKQRVYQNSVSVSVFIGGMRVVYPYIECSYEQQGNYTLLIQQSTNNININNSNSNNNINQLNNNKTLNKQSHQQQSTPFNNRQRLYSAHYYDRVTISVISQQNHLPLILSIMSIILLVLIIVVLIYWREKKLTLIDNIVSQIRRINSSKRHQLNQQNSIDKKWNQLKQQINYQQLSFKINNQQMEYNIRKQINYKTNQQERNNDQQQDNEYMSSQRGLNQQFYLLQNKNLTLYQSNSIQSTNKQLQYINRQQPLINNNNNIINSNYNKVSPRNQIPSSPHKHQSTQPHYDKLQTNINKPQQLQLEDSPFQSQQQNRKTLLSDLQIHDNSLLYRQLNQSNQIYQTKTIYQTQQLYQSKQLYQTQQLHQQHTDQYVQNHQHNDLFAPQSEQKQINLSILQQQDNDTLQQQQEHNPNIPILNQFNN